jgi:hypothetical protein
MDLCLAKIFTSRLSSRCVTVVDVSSFRCVLLAVSSLMVTTRLRTHSTPQRGLQAELKFLLEPERRRSREAGPMLCF